MPLINCIECDNRFSDYAQACPKCGCPIEVIKKELSSGNLSHNFKQIEHSEKELEDQNIEKFKNDNKEPFIVNSEKNADQDDNLKNKQKIGTIGWGLIILIVSVLLYVIFDNTYILNEAKNYVTYNGDTIEEQVKDYMMHQDYAVVYGWTSKKVENGIYFIAYEFDEDTDKSNGYIMYCYEYDRTTRIVREISGNRYLENKYKQLGYIE